MTETKRKLQRIKKRDNLTNKQLGELLGVKEDTVKKYIAEKVNPSADRMAIIDKIDAGGEMMSGQEVIRLADQIEDFVAGKIDLITFDKKFPDVIKLLVCRHCQKGLEGLL